jgi:hypothetical protein
VGRGADIRQLEQANLSAQEIHAVVTGTIIGDTNRMMEAVVSASLERLFPSVILEFGISVAEVARVR